MRITIDGAARRGGSGFKPTELAVPERVPVTVDFDPGRRIGTATCEQSDDGTITATAEINADVVSRLFGDGRIEAENLQATHPFLGIQAACCGGIDRPGIVTQIAVIGRNADVELPRYRMTVDLRDLA